jgi:ATP-dependent DNA ligase
VRQGASVRILSRNRRALEPYFPELAAAAIKGLPQGCSLDGELLALRDGKPEFSTLLERLGRRLDCQIQFVAFDLLSLEGEDLSALPLRERRRLLVSTVPGGGPKCVTLQTGELEAAEAWLQRSRMLHLEGVVAKRASEPYRPGKRSWVKIKHWDTVELVVGGCARTPERLSLLLGAYRDASLTYVGQTVAIPAGEASKLWRLLKASSVSRASVRDPHPAAAAGTATGSRSGSTAAGARLRGSVLAPRRSLPPPLGALREVATRQRCQRLQPRVAQLVRQRRVMCSTGHTVGLRGGLKGPSRPATAAGYLREAAT